MTQPHLKNLKGEALEWLMHATSGHATVADLRELEAWRGRSAEHAEAYRRAVAVWEALGSAAAEGATMKDRAMIAGHAPNRSQAFSRRRFLIGGAITSAAAATVGGVVVRPPLGLWPSFSDLMADYRTEVGEHRTVTLAESVSVEMNTRTSVIRRPGGDGERIELLTGEAVISSALKASNPLTVIAAEGQVIASAAQFNLRYDAGVVRVTCLEGSVQVGCCDNKVDLPAGKQLAYSSQGVSLPAVVDPALITAWRQGLLIFRDEPLARMLEEVNRYWRGRIVLLNEDLGRRHVTVRIELARIGEVISYTRSVLGANVRTLPGGIVVLT
jgi:transmembrane sensor